MDIILTIPANKLNEFKTGFLKSKPVPLDDDGNPTMTEPKWFKFWIKERAMHQYREGKRQLAEENIVIVEDVIN